MSDSDNSQGDYWDNMTAYRPPADRIDTAAKWHAPELDLHGRLDGQNNQLTALPDSIGNLHGITTLYLHDNQLTEVPDSPPDSAS